MFDTCALLAGGDACETVTEALCQLRFRKNEKKKRVSDIGIIPKEVLSELRGMRESVKEDVSSTASFRYNFCSSIPVLQMSGKRPNVIGNGSPTEKESTESGLMQLPSTQTFIWAKMRHFLRNADSHILAHALYFQQKLVLSKKEGGNKMMERNSFDNDEKNSDSAEDVRNCFESSSFPSWFDDVEEVVLVTNDQILATKAFAVYNLKAINPDGLLDVINREKKKS